jgi:hypothetical protein
VFMGRLLSFGVAVGWGRPCLPAPARCVPPKARDPGRPQAVAQQSKTVDAERLARSAGHPPPLVARLAITTAVTVPIMTWLVMPRVTRLLRRWLYPHS